jgi:hypothetical protein
MPVIVGCSLAVTVKLAVLVADPDGDVTAIGPVVAPEGTVVTSRVAVALTTELAVPLNVIVFRPGVGLNPVPAIVTVAPIAPVPGENAMIETVDEAKRAIESRLPIASYL